MRSVVVVAALAVALLAACTPKPGTVSNSAGPTSAPSSAPNKPAEQPTWGKRYTWSDGLAVEVAAPVGCKPGQYASPSDVKRAVKFKITIINGTDKPAEAAMFSVGGDAQFAGAKAESVFDSGGPCGDGGLDSGTILPGKTFSYEVAYAVGAQPGEMQLTFDPSVLQDKAVFVGQA